MSVSSITQYAVFLIIVTALVKPAGGYLVRVFHGDRTWLDRLMNPLERCVYSICRVDPKREMTWLQYAMAFVVFSAVGTLILYGILRLQSFLPG